MSDSWRERFPRILGLVGYTEEEALRYQGMKGRALRDLAREDPKLGAAISASELFFGCCDISRHLPYFGELEDHGFYKRVPGVCLLFSGVMANRGFKTRVSVGHATLGEFCATEDFEGTLVDAAYLSIAPSNTLQKMASLLLKIHQSDAIGPDLHFLANGSELRMMGTVVPLDEVSRERNENYIRGFQDFEGSLEDFEFRLRWVGANPGTTLSTPETHEDFLQRLANTFELGRGVFKNTSGACWLSCSLLLAMMLPGSWGIQTGLLPEVIRSASELRMFRENDDTRALAVENLRMAGKMRLAGSGDGGGYVQLGFFQLLFPPEEAAQHAAALRREKKWQGECFVLSTTPQQNDYMTDVASVLWIHGGGMSHVVCIVKIKTRWYLVDCEQVTPLSSEYKDTVIGEVRRRFERLEVEPVLHLYNGFLPIIHTSYKAPLARLESVAETLALDHLLKTNPLPWTPKQKDVWGFLRNDILVYKWRLGISEEQAIPEILCLSEEELDELVARRARLRVTRGSRSRGLR